MKTSKFLSLLLLFVLTASSCSKDDETPSGVDLGPVKMRAVVDGQNWSARNVTADTIQGQLSLTGIAGDGSAISLLVSGFDKGEYTSYPASSTACTWQPAAGTTAYASNVPSGSGLIVVEEINTQDTLVSGTFFFTGRQSSGMDSVVIRDGVFTEVGF